MSSSCEAQALPGEYDKLLANQSYANSWVRRSNSYSLETLREESPFIMSLEVLLAFLPESGL